MFIILAVKKTFSLDILVFPLKFNRENENEDE